MRTAGTLTLAIELKASIVAEALKQWPRKSACDQALERPFILRDIDKLSAAIRGDH